jgi:hypothetical protein
MFAFRCMESSYNQLRPWSKNIPNKVTEFYITRKLSEVCVIRGFVIVFINATKVRRLCKMNLVNVLPKYFLDIVFDITFPHSGFSAEICRQFDSLLFVLYSSKITFPSNDTVISKFLLPDTELVHKT